MLAQNQGCYKRFGLFYKLEILAQYENLYFSKTCFPNFFMIQKQDILNSLKHSVYGYVPLHIEISMFLALSSKYGFG